MGIATGGRAVTVHGEAPPTSLPCHITSTLASFILSPPHCPWHRLLRTTTSSFSPGPSSPVPPAATTVPTPHPTSPSTESQTAVNRHYLVLGLLLGCALCPLPFTGRALPRIFPQLKWRSLPISLRIRWGYGCLGPQQPIKDAWCQLDFSLLALTMITCPRQCLSSSSSVRLLPSLCLWCPLEKVSM